ncbi:MAG: ion transporter [Bacteroidaceae bacterium]|nr:ion transporter [Bacteroidaceae bacterium]
MKAINPYSSRADRLVMAVILLNSLVILLDCSGYHRPWLMAVDVACSLFFIVEMGLKMCHDGVLGYWRRGWNILDGTLVLLSLPSILFFILPLPDLSYLLILRLLRSFRFFRVIHFFPGAEQLGRNFCKALSECMSLFAGYVLIIIISAILSTSLFGEVAPQYFGTPWESVYSVFRLFSIEGWYDIPDAVATAYGPWGVLGVRLYFVLLLILGGVIGLSLINSVFVDAMLSDNNDEMLEHIKELEAKIDKLLEEKETK